MGRQGTLATTLLDRRGVSYRLHSYPHDSRASSYRTEAAQALGLAPQPLGHRKQQAAQATVAPIAGTT